MFGISEFIRSLFNFNDENKLDIKDKYSLAKIQEFVENNIDELIKTSIDEFSMKTEDVEKAKKRKEHFKDELEMCGLGNLASKEFLKSWISDLITQKYQVSEDNIDYIINFDFPENYDKLSIILYKYKQQYKFKALKELIDQHKLDQYKKVDNKVKIAITKDDINRIYAKNEKYSYLGFEEKLDIIVQRIYQNLLGLGVIDEILDQEIDGLSLGVSGIPIDFKAKVEDVKAKTGNDNLKFKFSYESVWLYFQGKEIYFQCLSFGSQQELERVCKKVYTFNSNRQFSAKDGFIFNNMADFTRVAVFRPPFAESWAVFLRKFDFDGDLDNIIKSKEDDVMPDLVKEFLKFLPRGKQKIIISGPQGSGKTTLLVGLIKKLYANSTLRIWESFFETFIRFKMQDQNVLTLREMPGLDGETALDSYKKSNGQIAIISEAATDIVVTYLIKVALTAFDFFMCTHHGVTSKKIVQAFRNAAINTGAFTNENIAEDQVLEILDWDIHLDIVNGERCIERITEYVVNENYNSRTGGEKYETVDIIVYDFENRKFIVKNKVSEQRKKQILKNLLNTNEFNDKAAFVNLIEDLETRIGGD